MLKCHHGKLINSNTQISKPFIQGWEEEDKFSLVCGSIKVTFKEGKRNLGHRIKGSAVSPRTKSYFRKLPFTLQHSLGGLFLPGPGDTAQQYLGNTFDCRAGVCLTPPRNSSLPLSDDREVAIMSPSQPPSLSRFSVVPPGKRI